MVRTTIIKRLLDIAEWLFFIYIVICLLIFNMIHFGNLLYVDTPQEEPMMVTSSFAQSLLFVISIGVICFFYLRYLRGDKVYKRIKAVLWGLLFAFNVLGSGFCLVMSDGLTFNQHETILLLLAPLISVALTSQAVMKYYECK
ncbi:hypothetical protein [Lysinibacillus cavernae]|uniref:hypothetical protein n=1 Tax=Lysinibacillus cavernae TaxID=2666135 RepID=UPI001E306BAB|nr:hypothetical protein [Lysinibacillus cavernae]